MNGFEVNRMKEEADAEHALHGQRSGLQRGRQIVAEDRDGRPEHRQDRHPKEHRPLVIPPACRHLIDQRHRRVGILGDIEHRKIGHHIGCDKRPESHDQKDHLPNCGRRTEAHQFQIAQTRSDQRHDRLRQRKGQCQNECKMSDFSDHHRPLIRG
jgi:hypothetical protein